MIVLLPGQRSSVAADGHNSLNVIPVKRDELTAVLVGGPIAGMAVQSRQNWAILSNSRWVPEFGDGCLPTRFCLDQGL
jgi:hypothetical protein